MCGFLFVVWYELRWFLFNNVFVLEGVGWGRAWWNWEGFLGWRRELGSFGLVWFFGVRGKRFYRLVLDFLLFL